VGVCRWDSYTRYGSDLLILDVVSKKVISTEITYSLPVEF